MKQFNKIIMSLLLFGLVAAQSAQAQVSLAPVTSNSARLVVSPYAQAAPNDSYTFIGVSHPSLDTAVTQIGVALEVIDMKTTVSGPGGRVTIFTVNAGETHRVFVANQSHPSINNSLEAADTSGRTHVIPTENSLQTGSIRATSISERPGLAAANRSVHVTGGTDRKFADLGQLNFWGVVYIEASGTGFAMEFIGDAHDSSLGGNISSYTPRFRNATGALDGVPRPGRGIGR